MLVVILFFVLLLSIILTPLAITCTRRLSIVDVANHRSSHVGVILSGGGVVFVLVFYLGFLTFLCLFSDACTFPLIVITFGSLIMAACGWVDDFKDLPVAFRFGIQIVTVAVSCFFLPRAWLFLPEVIEKAIIVFCWLWFINLFNFMDGTDGYAVQETFFICLGLFLLGSSTGSIALILCFSVLGFLRVNYPRAKIFMGDVGSVFLGYILGGFMLYSIAIKELGTVQTIMLTSLFLFDATYTLIKRGIQGKKVWRAHREHWYQRLSITEVGHKAIFNIGVAYNMIVICLLMLNKYYRTLMTAVFAVIIPCFILSCIVIYIKKKEFLAKIKKT